MLALDIHYSWFIFWQQGTAKSDN